MTSYNKKDIAYTIVTAKGTAGPVIYILHAVFNSANLEVGGIFRFRPAAVVVCLFLAL